MFHSYTRSWQVAIVVLILLFITKAHFVVADISLVVGFFFSRLFDFNVYLNATLTKNNNKRKVNQSLLVLSFIHERIQSESRSTAKPYIVFFLSLRSSVYYIHLSQSNNANIHCKHKNPHKKTIKIIIKTDIFTSCLHS